VAAVEAQEQRQVHRQQAEVLQHLVQHYYQQVEAHLVERMLEAAPGVLLH
jgi:hypothetical protein